MTERIDSPAATPARQGSPSGLEIEKRTIEHIPLDERHGRTRQLFTVWFGSNLMLLTVATGVLSTTVYGLSLGPALLSLTIGNLVGGVVMALHAAQGPRMGVPQMLQTRAQFGSVGSLLVVALVVFMYTGFFASNMVLGGQALTGLLGLPLPAAIVLIGLVSLVSAVAGYRLIHAVTGVMSVVAGLALLLAFAFALFAGGVPGLALSGGAFSWTGFMGTLSLAALWQIAYAPYVSDYTRYMRPDTGVRPAFWATYSGCVLGSLLPMVLGTLVGLASADGDTVGGLARVTGVVGPVVIAVFALGIAATNAMNLYCGALSMITVGQTVRPVWTPRAGTRAACAGIIFVSAVAMALASRDNFLVTFANFMLLLLCVLIPWTAVNLVDYYLIRRGDYDIASLFRPDGGVYGRVNVAAVCCYVVGILVQLPFLSTSVYTGVAAEALGKVDISWIVGLAVVGPLYYVWVRWRARR
ncbi:purine-cytosine permease family protein [Pseudonocardia acaciae]|uniref:purine-cytosine permease family protein n=1 Tax=Pseudonocardia acaciae TaxID=551276 RepID=UPI00048F0D0C|nr:cytosine permease [Pseudonocardia acaciae]